MMAKTQGQSRVEKRLLAAGHVVPAIPEALAKFVPWRRLGTTIYVSGQIPIADGKPTAVGRAGKELTLQQAQDVARRCALGVIAVLRDAAGGQLDQVRLVKTVNFVAVAPGFTDVHLVANGASELFALAFGEKGIHARTSVGVSELPFGVPFEIEAVAELE